MSSNFNFNGPVNGPLQAGDHNRMDVTVNAPVTDAVVEQAARLLQLVQQQAPQLQTDAQQVHRELTAAAQSGTAPDRSQLRVWLTNLTSGLATGSAALVLAQQVNQLFFN